MSLAKSQIEMRLPTIQSHAETVVSGIGSTPRNPEKDLDEHVNLTAVY